MRALFIGLVIGVAALGTETAFAQPAPPPPQPQPPIAGPAPAGGQTVIVVQGAPPPRREVVILEDGARFRGGIALEGGVLALPAPALNFGAIGLQGQIGVQINNLVGVYDVPGFDILFGPAGGLNVSDAVLVDFTFVDRFTVGVGPDVGAFLAFGASSTGSGATASAAAGAGFGGRLHLAVYPVVGRSEFGPRRRALAIGLDTRFLAGPNAGVSESCTTANCTSTGGGSAYGLMLHAMLTVGYQAF